MPIRVFYLDDEPELCNIFLEFFTSEEVIVDIFFEPSAAILACHQTPPTLFFIDYRLPGTTGDEVAQETDKNIPKVLVTGDLSVEAKYPFTHIVPKPFDFISMQNIINKYL